MKYPPSESSQTSQHSGIEGFKERPQLDPIIPRDANNTTQAEFYHKVQKVEEG